MWVSEDLNPCPHALPLNHLSSDHVHVSQRMFKNSSLLHKTHKAKLIILTMLTGFKYIYNIVQPSSPSISRTFSSLTKKLLPWNNTSSFPTCQPCQPPFCSLFLWPCLLWPLCVSWVRRNVPLEHSVPCSLVFCLTAFVLRCRGEQLWSTLNVLGTWKYLLLVLSRTKFADSGMRLEVADLYDYFISVGEKPHFQTVRDRLLQHKCNHNL